MKIKVLCFFFLFISFFLEAQNKKSPTWNYRDLKICREKTGKKANISQYLLSEDKEYYYTYEKVLLTEVVTKWVKKDANRNCLSVDPNDCLVWCLVEVPATYSNGEKITVSAKDVSIEGNEKYKNGMVETICMDNITEEMFDVLTQKLIGKHYIRRIKDDENEVDYAIFCREQLFDALEDYQKDNHFVRGFFDIKTLKKLGIVTE